MSRGNQMKYGKAGIWISVLEVNGAEWSKTWKQVNQAYDLFIIC